MAAAAPPAPAPGCYRYRRRRRRLRAASYLPPSADLSLPLGRRRRLLLLLLLLCSPERLAGLPADRPASRLLSTGSVRGVPARRLELFEFELNLLARTSAAVTRERERERAVSSMRGAWHRYITCVRDLPVAVVVREGAPEQGGQGQRARRTARADGRRTLSPSLPPRQEKLLKRRIFFSGSRRGRVGRSQSERGDGRQRRQCGRCLVMSDASPCVCDNNLAPSVAVEGGASETTAASYMC